MRFPKKQAESYILNNLNINLVVINYGPVFLVVHHYCVVLFTFVE